MDDIDPEAWRIEGESVLCGLDCEVYELADCVELPDELEVQATLADCDPGHEENWDEWFEFIHNSDLLLPVEQSCNSEGLLLPWDMRGVRLWTLPADLLSKLHLFFDECPRHTQALLVNHVFWLVRFERVRRLGSPILRLQDVEFPDEEEPAFFRPNLLTIRYSGR
jgi:hypothetical protein